MKRTGGNRKRYEAFLQRFAETQSHAVDDIRSALAANDSPTAQRFAHSLKGVSANLGANGLAEVAAAAEAAIESNRSEEHTSELQSRRDLVCRLLLEKKKKRNKLAQPRQDFFKL